MDYKNLENDVKINLADAVKDLVNKYLTTVGNTDVNNLYEMVLEQIEPPLLQATIENEKFNQSRAAKVLGLSRGTTRAKLIKYFGDKYCGTRDEMNA